MRRLNALLQILLFIVILSGCSSLKHVGDYNAVFTKQGYSVLPPQGKGWLYFDNDYKIVFTKRGDTSIHTYAAEVTNTTGFNNISFDSREDFLKFMKNITKMGTDPNRFYMQEEEMVLDDRFGPYCVRYYARSNDYAAAKAYKVRLMILELYGYYFIHPDNKNSLVSIIYSERGTPGDNSLNLKEVAQKFVDGFKINPN